MADTRLHSDVGSRQHLVVVTAERGTPGLMEQLEPTVPQCPGTMCPLSHYRAPRGCLGVSSASSHHLPFLSCKILVAEHGCNALTWEAARANVLLLVSYGCMAGRRDKKCCVILMWLVLCLCILHGYLTTAAFTYKLRFSSVLMPAPPL